MAQERLLGLSDIAEMTGMSRQGVWDYLNRGAMPEPDFIGPKEGPLWRKKTVRTWIRQHKRK